VHSLTNELPVFEKTCITIGTFDGVHRGHRAIIRQLVQHAGEMKVPSVLITFDPHPRQILKKPGAAVKLINSPGEKLELLKSCGLDHVVIVPFTTEFSSIEPVEYIRQFLVKKFNPLAIVIGYDHRFGKNRQGDYKLLEAYGAEFNFKVVEIPAQLVEDASISSTRIRAALSEGDIMQVNTYLPYTYFFSGEIVQGKQLGRTIGFPTANIGKVHPDKLLPSNGVYAVQVQLEGSSELFDGMMNIGVRPTVDGINQVTEVNLFNFDKDVYGKKTRVFVHGRLRNEQKFTGIDALQQQLHTDRENATEFLSRLPAPVITPLV